MCAAELKVETHSNGAENSNAAQRDYGESAALEGRVDVGLEVEIVLIILIHPKAKISNNKRLDDHQDLNRAGNMSSRSLDMLVRTPSPDQKISTFNPAHHNNRFDKGELCPRESNDSIHVGTSNVFFGSYQSSLTVLLCGRVSRRGA